MIPLQLQHLEYIQSEVIPMTDEQRAADHAEISVRFAIERLKSVFDNNSTFYLDAIQTEINWLLKTLNNK